MTPLGNSLQQGFSFEPFKTLIAQDKHLIKEPAEIKNNIVDCVEASDDQDEKKASTINTLALVSKEVYNFILPYRLVSYLVNRLKELHKVEFIAGKEVADRLFAEVRDVLDTADKKLTGKHLAKVVEAVMDHPVTLHTCASAEDDNDTLYNDVKNYHFETCCMILKIEHEKLSSNLKDMEGIFVGQRIVHKVMIFLQKGNWLIQFQDNLPLTIYRFDQALGEEAKKDRYFSVPAGLISKYFELVSRSNETEHYRRTKIMHGFKKLLEVADGAEQESNREDILALLTGKKRGRENFPDVLSLMPEEDRLTACSEILRVAEKLESVLSRASVFSSLGRMIKSFFENSTDQTHRAAWERLKNKPIRIILAPPADVL